MFEPYFISVEEDISYDQTTNKWVSTSHKIAYACQTDACNKASLLKQLPAGGLSLSISDSNWLSTNLLRQLDQNTTLCRDCSAQPLCGKTQYAVNMSECELQSCSGSCLTTEQIRSTEANPYCYQMFCSPETSTDSDMMSAKISIEAVYYLNEKTFDINEIDITCNGKDCTSLNLFRDIKGKLKNDLRGIQAFLPRNHVNSIYFTSFLSLVVVLFQILVRY